MWKQVTMTEMQRVFGDKKPKTIAEMITIYQAKVEYGSVIPRFDPSRMKKQTARLLVRPPLEKAGGKNKDKTEKGSPKSKKGGGASNKKKGAGESSRKGQERGSRDPGQLPYEEYLKTLTCHRCGKKGHKAKFCPEKNSNPGNSQRKSVPRATGPPPLPRTKKKAREQFSAEEEKKAPQEVIVNFEVQREQDGFVAVHDVNCSWVDQAMGMGHSGGYCRYAVKDLEDQKRGDLYAPGCCKKDLEAAGHTVTLDMLSTEVVTPFPEGARY